MLFQFCLLFLLFDTFCWLFLLAYDFINDKDITRFIWYFFINFLLFLLLFNLFFFWIIRKFILLIRFWLLHFFRPTPSSSWDSFIVSSSYFLSLLATSFAWIRVCEIKIAIELISTRTASFVLRLVLIFVFPLQIPSEIDIITVPELIFVDFALHKIFHFGSPFASELHTLDGSFNWRAFLWLLIVLTFTR